MRFMPVSLCAFDNCSHYVYQHHIYQQFCLSDIAMHCDYLSTALFLQFLSLFGLLAKYLLISIFLSQRAEEQIRRDKERHERYLKRQLEREKNILGGFRKK